MWTSPIPCGSSGSWTQSSGQNDGLPYLAAVKAPENTPTTKITVTVAVAAYDKAGYAFSLMGGDAISVTLDSTGNTRVVDVMDAAAEQGLLTYS